ncbi:EF-hand_domain [Hexamita inflata]|uniref:EF-hand domain n=1 Tax=Hexamita inflata TaxID=28002 RepID=A0AA86UKR1_9EUKA|nr:EF-hand domain [Hexamita inflata]
MSKYSIDDFARLFKEADSSHDHKLTLIEIIQFLQLKNMKVNEDRIKKYFSMFDKDQSQHLNITEFIKLMDLLYGDE